MRTQPDDAQVAQLLSLAGLKTDAAGLERVRRRLGFLQTDLEVLDRLDLAMVDPAFVFHPDVEEV